MPTPSGSDGLYRKRIIRLLVAGIIVELALAFLAYRGPALAPLMTGLYGIVALLFGIAIWRTRHRSGDDRRHDDRRHPDQP